MLRLDAVNRILVSAQMQPVATLSSPDRLVSKATTILDDTVLRELERGWDFNTDYDYELTPTASEFILPTTPWSVLALDIRRVNSYGKDIVVRDGKLWDRTNHTSTFTEATINADITWDIDFDNCPLVFQEYAVACASVRFAVEVSVDPSIAQQLRVNEARTWAALKQRDTQQAELTVYDRWPLNSIASKWPGIHPKGTRG